jgi:hypothetical protein
MKIYARCLGTEIIEFPITETMVSVRGLNKNNLLCGEVADKPPVELGSQARMEARISNVGLHIEWKLYERNLTDIIDACCFIDPQTDERVGFSKKDQLIIGALCRKNLRRILDVYSEKKGYKNYRRVEAFVHSEVPEYRGFAAELQKVYWESVELFNLLLEQLIEEKISLEAFYKGIEERLKFINSLE